MANQTQREQLDKVIEQLLGPAGAPLSRDEVPVEGRDFSPAADKANFGGFSR